MTTDIRTEISSLNPRQREAVLHTEGPLLILAGAGSGKTRVITMRAAWLLENGVPPGEVLAVTFTNKAAREMKERITALLKNKRGKGPVVSTFHSLCLNILRNEIEHLGYRKDFTIYDTSEQVSLVRNIMADIEVPDRSFKIDVLMEQISRTKNGMEPSGDQKQDAALAAVSESLSLKYQEALKAFNAVDFDDLLLLALRLFREHPQVLEKYRQRYKYLMVDEYQDTNRIQYEFIRLLAGIRRNLCVVGDDDQSIYGWRGAALDNILDFEKDFPGTKIVRLEQNYRSKGHILQAANGVIRHNKKRMEKSLWTERGSGDKPKIIKLAGSDDEAKWVADRIAMIRYEKKRTYEDFAVIYRANNLARPFEEALRMLRIPYTVVGGTSYFERKEIRDIAAYLKIMVNSRDDLSLIRIANTPKRGLGPGTMGKIATFAREQDISLLDAFMRAGKVPEIGEKIAASAVELAALVERYRELFAAKKEMAVVLKDLVRELDYSGYLYDLYKTPEAAAKKVQNVEDFIGSLSHYESSQEERPEDEPTLLGFLETMSLTDMDRREEKMFGVTLISLHSSKGLEFPVVFMVGVEEDILPHRKSIADDVEEERRLFYVGVTRAMDELYITHTGQRERYGKEQPSTPSRFIEEIPAAAIEKLDRMAEATPEETDRKARAFFENIKAMMNQ